MQPGDDPDAVVEARVVGEGEEGSDGAGFRVVGGVDESADAGVDEQAGAHGAGFEGDDAGAVVEAPVADVSAGVEDGGELGVCGGVGEPLALVEGLGEGLAGGGAVDDGADGDLAEGRGVACQFQGAEHESAVDLGGGLGGVRGSREESAEEAGGEVHGSVVVGGGGLGSSDAFDGEEVEEHAAEFVEGVHGEPEEDHGPRISGCENGGEDGGDEDGVFAVPGEPGAVDDAGPSEEENDGGGLESAGEGEGESEDGVDVVGDAVLLEDSAEGGEFGAEDEGLVVPVAEADAVLPEGAVDPDGADLGAGRVGLEDGEGGEGDAGWRFGGGDAGGAGGGSEVNEKVEEKRENDQVHEERAGDGKGGGERDEDVDKASFVPVQAGGDELPELVEEPGTGQDEGDDEGDLEVGVEGFEDAGGLKGGGKPLGAEGFAGGAHEQFEELSAEDEGEHQERADAPEGEDQSAAQLFEMLAEGHGGLFGVVARHEIRPVAGASSLTGKGSRGKAWHGDRGGAGHLGSRESMGGS